MLFPLENLFERFTAPFGRYKKQISEETWKRRHDAREIWAQSEGGWSAVYSFQKIDPHFGARRSSILFSN